VKIYLRFGRARRRTRGGTRLRQVAAVIETSALLKNHLPLFFLLIFNFYFSKIYFCTAEDFFLFIIFLNTLFIFFCLRCVNSKMDEFERIKDLGKGSFGCAILVRRKSGKTGAETGFLARGI
jgi:hypothetical protein